MAQRIRVTHLLLAGGLVLAAQPAFAQEGMLFKNLVEGTFGKGSGDDIDYRERAPLVVPPNSALPPPQQAAGSRNAAWPNDPDVERRKAAKVGRYAPNTVKDELMLSSQEIRRGRTDRAPVQAPTPPTNEHDVYATQIGPVRVGKELAAKSSREADEQVSYGQEPPRRLLSEPPVGYRRPAGTAAVGPGQGAVAVEDKDALGIREFSTGQGPVMMRQ